MRCYVKVRIYFVLYIILYFKRVQQQQQNCINVNKEKMKQFSKKRTNILCSLSSVKYILLRCTEKPNTKKLKINQNVRRKQKQK